MDVLTSNSMITPFLGTNPTVPIAVESGHGLLGEQGKRFLEDYEGLSANWYFSIVGQIFRKDF